MTEAEAAGPPPVVDMTPEPQAAAPNLRHDAFICYSRKNEAFAGKLEQALENYRPPRDLGVPQRYLDVFRDKSDFTGGEYQRNLEKHLSVSEKLIVICSPQASKSVYVNDEIRRFAQLKGDTASEHIIPLLLSGIPNNEAGPGREEELAFPEALCQIMEMPLAVDFRGFDAQTDKLDRGDFSAAWYTVLANIYEVSRGEVEQREKKRRARARRITYSLLTASIVVLSVLLLLTFLSRREAIRQQGIAEERLRQNQQLLYVSDINFAQKMHLEKRTGWAIRALETYLHERRELRGFEWHYLMAQYRDARGDASSPEGFARLEGHARLVSAVAFSPDSRTLASGSVDGTVRLWDVNSRQELAPHLAHTQAGYVTTVVFSPDGKVLASGSTDKTVKLWEVASRRELAKLEGHADIVISVAFSPDGRTLATSGRDKKIKLWDVASHKELVPLNGHTNQIMAVAFSPDGKMLASASWDNTVRLWDVASRKELHAFEGHDRAAFAVAFSPDSKRLFTSGLDTKVKIWDVASRELLGVFDPQARDERQGERAAVKTFSALALSTDGRTLATTSDLEGTLFELWDVDARRPLVRIAGQHTGTLRGMVLSPDSRALAAGSPDGTVWLWRYNSD